MVFHQQLYHQHYYVQQQMMPQQNTPSQYIPHGPQGSVSEQNQTTPNFEINATLINSNVGSETAQSDSRSPKRQRHAAPNDPNAIEPTNIEPTPFKAEQFEPAPIEASIEIQPLENTMIRSSPTPSN